MKRGHSTPPAVIDAIAADVRAGHPTADIAARHGVSRKTVNRYAVLTGAREPRRITRPARPIVACVTCGNDCRPTGTEGICRTCRMAEGDHSPVGLTGGYWATRGGISVWVEGEPEAHHDGRGKCGTVAGYHSHYRHAHEEPCWDCRVAHAVAQVADAPEPVGDEDVAA